MPPPPPPRSEEGDGPTKSGPAKDNVNASGRSPPAYTPAEKEKKREQEREKDEILEEKLNGEQKISRQFMISLALLLFYTVYQGSSVIQTVFEYSIVLDEYTLTGTFEDSYEHILTFNQLFLCGFSFMFFALCLNMYYYVFLGENKVGGSLGVLVDYLKCRDPTKGILYWVVVGLYGLGVILYCCGFLSLMVYLFDEDDYSPYYVDEDDADDDTLDALFGAKTYYWALLFCYPFYCVIVCVQHLFPQFTLAIFEARVCLWSTVLFIGTLIYALVLTSDNFYGTTIASLFRTWYAVYSSYPNDDIEDAEEGNYVFARLSTWGAMLGWLVLAIYSGFGAQNVILKKQDSEASTPNAFKLYVLMAVILFILMLLVTIASGLTDLSDVSTTFWIGTIVVFADILC